MSDSFQIVDIVIWAMIAGLIFLRLRSVLGRRTGGERPPQDGRFGGRQAAAGDSNDQDGDHIVPGQEDETGIDSFKGLAPQVRQGLEAIWRKDKGFDMDRFLDGASKAYAVILEGFWAGSKEDIRPFISDDIFAQFSSAIETREKDGLTVENKLVETTEMAVDDARLEGDIAEITLRFVSDIISITRDRDGGLVEGNMSDAVKVTDIWTFAKGTRSNDPNWTLVATRAG
jgi:predicted lipid-binding transport protein (Tim44 family)